MTQKINRPEKKQQKISRSLNYAYQGIVYVMRTQRNMRLHAVAAVLVLVISLLVNVTKLELAVLILVIMAVFVTEMFNTAIEFAVDLVTREYHPLAKLAKDVSAGAVLVASVTAIAVGYLILVDNLGPFTLDTLERVRNWPGHLTLVALILVTVIVLIGKALTHSPNSFAGGMPSGHSAVAFAGWVAASFISDGYRYGGLISLITLLMALLVSQSRVEAGIHTIYQVAVGAVIGVLVTVAVFQMA